MAARRVINPINWTGIAERLAEKDKPIFATLRTKSDGYLSRMQQYPESAPAIDWAYYKKAIPVAGMVERFQKEYDSLKIPYPADTYTSKVEEQEKDAHVRVQAYLVESEQRIKEAKADIARIQGLIPFDEMSMEDYCESYPDVGWNPDKPTIWPHDPETQPGPTPIPIPYDEH